MGSLSDTKAVTDAGAFAEREDEQRIALDRTEHKFEFTRRWFVHRNLSTYSTFLPARFPAKKAHNILHIGVFEGMDLVWICQNLFRNKNSRILAIDPWEKTRKLSPEQMNAVFERARRNLRPWNDRINMIRGLSQDVMISLVSAPTQVCGKTIAAGKWDLIIVDGDHNADPVYADAQNALRLVKPGGWIVFDDVRNRFKKKDHVYHGLIGWLMEQGDDVDLVWAHRHMNCYRRKLKT